MNVIRVPVFSIWIDFNLVNYIYYTYACREDEEEEEVEVAVGVAHKMLKDAYKNGQWIAFKF